jgi:predicted lipoprotein
MMNKYSNQDGSTTTRIHFPAPYSHFFDVRSISMALFDRPALKSGVLLIALALLSVWLSGCVIATVRSLEEDQGLKAGFSPEAYVEEIWESRVLPAYREQAQELTALLAQLDADEQGTIARFGHRSGTGPYSFMVRGEGVFVGVDTSSRSGVATVDLNPPDGTPDLTLVIGPLIKISQRAGVRDAVGFIEYGNFTNQQEFAGVANAMGERIVQHIATALGVESPDAIAEIDPAQYVGKSVRFIGAFTFEDRKHIVVVPVELEVGD